MVRPAKLPFAITALALAGSSFLAPTAQAAQQQPSARPSGTVTVKANPGRVCFTGRQPSYLNFDLLIANGTGEELELQELRGVVLDARGAMTERRLIWQQALGQLSPDRTIAANAEGLVFNPLLFATAVEGSTIRYELDFAGASGKRSAAATVVPQGCANSYSLKLPVQGRVLVYDGYDLHSHHRRTGYGGPGDAAQGITDNFQRFGIDLVIVDEAGRFFSGDGSRPDQWLGWGRPVRAAGEGVVEAVHDGQPDNQVIGDVDKWTDRDMIKNPMTSYGNYVLIRHAEGEYSLAGHLKQGSVRVRKGQRVGQGEVIGAIGNSGASGGVHVHFERRTGFGIAGIATLPPYFKGVAIEGSGPAPAGAIAIDSGDVLVSE